MATSQTHPAESGRSHPGRQFREMLLSIIHGAQSANPRLAAVDKKTVEKTGKEVDKIVKLCQHRSVLHYFPVVNSYSLPASTVAVNRAFPKIHILYRVQL